MGKGERKGGRVRGCFSQIDFSVHTFTPKGTEQFLLFFYEYFTSYSDGLKLQCMCAIFLSVLVFTLGISTTLIVTLYLLWKSMMVFRKKGESEASMELPCTQKSL